MTTPANFSIGNTIENTKSYFEQALASLNDESLSEKEKLSVVKKTTYSAFESLKNYKKEKEKYRLENKKSFKKLWKEAVEKEKKRCEEWESVDDMIQRLNSHVIFGRNQ